VRSYTLVPGSIATLDCQYMSVLAKEPNSHVWTSGFDNLMGVYLMELCKARYHIQRVSLSLNSPWATDFAAIFGLGTTWLLHTPSMSRQTELEQLRDLELIKLNPLR